MSSKSEFRNSTCDYYDIYPRVFYECTTRRTFDRLERLNENNRPSIGYTDDQKSDKTDNRDNIIGNVYDSFFCHWPPPSDSVIWRTRTNNMGKSWTICLSDRVHGDVDRGIWIWRENPSSADAFIWYALCAYERTRTSMTRPIGRRGGKTIRKTGGLAMSG